MMDLCWLLFTLYELACYSFCVVITLKEVKFIIYECFVYNYSVNVSNSLKQKNGVATKPVQIFFHSDKLRFVFSLFQHI